MTSLADLPRYAGHTIKCFGKVAYDSKGEALRTFNRIHARGRMARGLQPYHCDVCGKFHLGRKGGGL